MNKGFLFFALLASVFHICMVFSSKNHNFFNLILQKHILQHLYGFIALKYYYFTS